MSKASVRTGLAFGMGVVVAGAAAFMAGAGRAAEHQPTTPDRTSYAIGHDLGVSTLERLRVDGVEYQPEAVLQGFQDAMLGQDLAYSLADIDVSLALLQREVSTRLAQARYDSDVVFRALADENMRKSNAFLEKFAARDTTRTLADGVMYEVRQDGTGPSPGAASMVRISVQARLIDGTLIGDEPERATRVDGMIAGAKAVITGMKVGERRIVALSPEQAFGIGGQLPDIGPNQAIIADVTLLGIDQ